MTHADAQTRSPRRVITGAHSNPESRRIQEYGAFDLLRFGLASAVALSHSGIFTWVNSGNLAVQVFFALSGWLIGTILYRTKPSQLNRFYYNRSTRIWIPYFACVAALYTVSALHEPARSTRWFEFLGYDITFTHNWFTLTPNAAIAISQMPLQGTGNHFWSLAVEEQFYLVAPLIITLLPTGRSIATWACITALAYLTGSWYASISVSVLAVMVTGRFPNWYRTNAYRWALVVIFLCAAYVMSRFPSVYSYAAPPFSVALVILCAYPLRRTAASRWLGGVSFPFYLNAWIGVFALHAIEKHFGMNASQHMESALEFAFSLGAGALTYHLIDVQVMERRDGFYKKSIGWALGATGYVLVLAGTVLWLVESR